MLIFWGRQLQCPVSPPLPAAEPLASRGSLALCWQAHCVYHGFSSLWQLLASLIQDKRGAQNSLNKNLKVEEAEPTGYGNFHSKGNFHLISSTLQTFKEYNIKKSQIQLSLAQDKWFWISLSLLFFFWSVVIFDTPQGTCGRIKRRFIAIPLRQILSQ